MASRILHPLATILLLLYSSVTIIGEGWHALLPAGICGCCEDCCYGQRAADCESLSDRAQLRQDKQTSHGDCPVCAFLAQVQNDAEPLELPSHWQAVSTCHPITTFLSGLQPIHEPYSARGPPTLYCA